MNINDLVKNPSDGLYYKKFDVPFTGELVTGLEQGSYKDGKRDGPWVSYWEYGQLMSKGDYKDGTRDGPWVSYHNNGQLSLKGGYKDGKEDGPWVEYHDNGQLWVKGDYKDGKRDGPWVWYYENGTKNEFLSETYRNGKRLTHVNFYTR